MKKILTILLVLFAFVVKAQDLSPLPNTDVKKLIAPNNPVFYFNNVTNDYWVFMGQYGWKRLAGTTQLNDSLSNYWSKQEITPEDTARWNLNSGGASYVTGLSVSGTTLKTITLTQLSGGTKTATFTDLTGGTGSQTFSQAYLNEADITSTTVTVAYPTSFPHVNYALNLRAWYVNEIDGKQVQIAHAIYDFTKSVSGFSFKVDTVAGRYSYFAADTTMVLNSGEFRTKIVNEVPIGLVNSSNTAYSLKYVPNPNTQQLYMNGVRLAPTLDYSITANNITMNFAPITGFTLLADYSIGTVITNEYYNEVPSGTINGINTIFTLLHSVSGTDIELFVNGIRQQLGIDFTVSGTDITFLIAPLTGYTLLADYKN